MSKLHELLDALVLVCLQFFENFVNFFKHYKGLK